MVYGAERGVHGRGPAAVLPGTPAGADGEGAGGGSVGWSVIGPGPARALGDRARDSANDAVDRTAPAVLVQRFKENYRRSELVGRYISALANSAALHDKPHGYVLWGVRNSTHEMVGTDFLPGDSKKGNELIEPWLARLLDPHVRFQFEETKVDGSRIVLLQV
ncbi:MAG: ATP-binding protein, partial [Gemmatimonadetes bacterium]|nr:ATP-binding protein [Gemmatimonadota bacterium]